MPAKSSERQEKPAETPHYHGHRERLRERFHSAGPDALSDYELLEMALFPALPRRDTKPLAKALLKKFGSFAEVVHAPEMRLREIEGIGDASIHQLKLIAAAAGRIAKGQLRQRKLLSSWNDVIDYCRTTMDGIGRQYCFYSFRHKSLQFRWQLQPPKAESFCTLAGRSAQPATLRYI